MERMRFEERLSRPAARLPLAVLAIVAAVFLAGCGGFFPGDVEASQGAVAFAFQNHPKASDASVAAQSGGELPDNLESVLVSIEDAQGQAVLDQYSLALTPFGSGYLTENLQLAVGEYRITAFLVLDDTDEVRFAAPLEGSDLADFVDDPLPVDFSVTHPVSEKVTIQVLSVDETADPADFGYVEFEPDLAMGPFNFTYRALGAQADGPPIPIPFQRYWYGVSRTGKGAVSSGGGFPVIRSAGIYWEVGNSLGPTVYPGSGFQLQLRSFGYLSSPLLTFAAQDLYPLADNIPVVDVVLEPDLSYVSLAYVGPVENGHKYTARLTESQYVSESIAALGGDEEDIYSFYLEFSLRYFEEPDGSPFTGAPESGTALSMWSVPRLAKGPTPYDSSEILQMDDYLNLAAELVVDEEGHALVQNDSVDKVMEVYVEVLIFEDDGGSVIDEDEEFIGFQSETLLIPTERVSIE